MIRTKSDVSWIGKDYTTAKIALIVGSMLYAGIIVEGMLMIVK